MNTPPRRQPERSIRLSIRPFRPCIEDEQPLPLSLPSSPGSLSSESSNASSLTVLSLPASVADSSSASALLRRHVRKSKVLIRSGGLFFCLLVSGYAIVQSLSLGRKPDGATVRFATLPTNRELSGTFNGFPLTKVEESPLTTPHCIGENYNKTSSWLFRSCDFETYCFDIDAKEFVIYLEEPPVQYEKPKSHYMRGFSSTNPSLEGMATWAGSQSRTWLTDKMKTKYKFEEDPGKFRPRVKIGEAPSMYYSMPDTTIVNFFRHNKSYKNPGHLVWDDFMGIYTLLDLFDRFDDQLMLSELNRTVAPRKMVRVPFEKDMIRKFLPLMGEHDYNIRTYEGFDLFKVEWPNKGEDRVVCAGHGLVGSGMFSDHGHDRWHGQAWEDYVLPHNVGRGANFRRFREYMMKNVGINPDTQIQRPYQMIVSQNSTTKDDRSGLMFYEQIDALVSKYGTKRIHFRTVILSELSLKEQIEMATHSAFFLSVVGGGCSTAFFLPKGASLMLYADNAKLDWDLFNNYPHLKTHWLPRIKHMLLKDEMKYFVDLVGSELSRLDRLTALTA